MILLLVLAIFDNITTWIGIVSVKQIYNLFPFSSDLWFCHISSFIYVTALFMSSWLIVVITVERTIAVYWHFKLQIYSVIMSLMVVMCLINLPVFFISSITKVETMYQSHFTGSDSFSATILLLIIALLYCIIPFFTILTLNVLMLRKIYSQRKFRTQNQRSQHGKHPNSTNLTVTMFAVCFVFIMTTLPTLIFYLIIGLLNVLGRDIIIHDSLFFHIAYEMDYINHSVNFILHYVTGSVFRQTLVHLFTCQNRIKSRRHNAQHCQTEANSLIIFWYVWNQSKLMVNMSFFPVSILQSYKR